MRGPSRGPGASHSVSTLRGSCEMTDCLCPQAQIPVLSLQGSLSEDCFPLQAARLQLNERRGHSGMFQLIGAEVGGGVGWGGVDFRVRPAVPYADSVWTRQHPRFRLPAYREIARASSLPGHRPSSVGAGPLTSCHSQLKPRRTQLDLGCESNTPRRVHL